MTYRPDPEVEPPISITRTAPVVLLERSNELGVKIEPIVKPFASTKEGLHGLSPPGAAPVEFVGPKAVKCALPSVKYGSVVPA